MYEYAAKPDRVVDGDTLIVLVDHGMSIRSSQSLRLLRVFAPELHAGAKSAPGVAAKAEMQAWIDAHASKAADGWGLRIKTEKDNRTFNRYLAEVTCSDCGESLNDHQRSLGYTDLGTGAGKAPK